MITKIESKTTKTGKPYKAVQLRNATGTIRMYVWDNMLVQLHDVNSQDIVHIVGSKGDFGIELSALYKIDPKTVDMADYYDIGNQAVIKKEYTQIMDYRSIENCSSRRPDHAKQQGAHRQRQNQGKHPSCSFFFVVCYCASSINSSIACSTGAVYFSPPKSHCSCCMSNSRISGFWKCFL